MLTVDPMDDGAVRARCYALVIATRRGGGGEAIIHRSTVCEDELVPSDAGWAVRKRVVTRDDLT
jgi:hypothetical protein